MLAEPSTLLHCDAVNSVTIVPNEKVALDRLRVRQNVFLVLEIKRDIGR